MKKAIKILCFTLTLTMLLTLTSLAVDPQEGIIPETGTEQSGEENGVGKAFSENIDYNTDFADDCFIVILQHEYGVINASITADYFPEISDNIAEIEDLSYVEDPESLLSDSEYLSRYKQMLCVCLQEHGTDKVVEAITALDGRTDIYDVYPNYIYEKTEELSVPNDYSIYSTTKSAYDLIDLPEAWNISTGSSSVKVAVIDTGVLSHYDLDGNVITGYDAHNQNTITNDIPGYIDSSTYTHGTSVAGIIGAVSNNGSGISGVTRDVSIVPIQYWSSISFVQEYNDWCLHHNYADFARAINYLNNNNILIANMSLGSKGGNLIDEYIMNNYRGLFVVSAGNEGLDLDGSTKYYPACYDCDNMIIVGNCTNGDVIYEDSNVGSEHVDLFAPGTNIYSTYVSYNNGSNTQTFQPLFGTSISAPMVTGVAALIKSYNPNLDAMDIKRLILDNVDVVSAYSGHCVTGGRLNAYKALQAATQLEETDTKRFVGKTTNDTTEDVVEVRKLGDKFEILTYAATTGGALSNYSPMSGDDYTTIKYYRTVTDFTYNELYEVSILSGDVDGDGYMDIVFVYAGLNGNRSITVHYGYRDKDGYRTTRIQFEDGSTVDFSAGGRFDYSKTVNTQNSADTEMYPSKFFVADATGDGKDDLIVMYKNPGGVRSVLVYRTVMNMISGTPAATETVHSYVGSDPVFTGDVNGDNKTDLIIHWASNNQRRLTVLTSLGTTYATQGNTLTTTNSTLASYCSKFTVCDVNGDGNDDFVVVYKVSGSYFAQLAYLGGGNATSASLSAGVKTTTTVPFYDVISISSGDINCNQCEDVVVEYANANVKRCLTVFYGNFGGSFTNNGTYVTANSANSSTYVTNTVYGDFTGSGGMDVMAIWTERNEAIKTMNYITYSSRGSSISATSLVPYITKTSGSINVPYYTYD